VDVLEAKGVNQKAVDGIGNLGVVNQVHHRLKDGDILIDALDERAEEDEDPLWGVLLLGTVAEDEAPGHQRRKFNWVVGHRYEHNQHAPRWWTV
jgi:hypothetical protein